MRIETGSWHGEAATTLGSSQIAVTVVPRRGGKIASILDLTNGREWLEQPAGDYGPAPVYGGNFTAADVSGWDEMVPTIVSCEYEGVSLPDHGEVWSGEWDVESGGGALVCRSAGRALPYSLTRKMAVEGPKLILDYSLANIGDEPLQLLWAAHPLFTVSDSGTSVVLPSDVDQIIDVLATPPRPEPWPNSSFEGVARMPPKSGRKFYVQPERRIRWAALLDGDRRWLRMAWDPEVVPYLGVWLDNCAYTRRPAIALEPSTGYYDDLSVAARLGRVSSVQAAQFLTWTVQVEVGSGVLGEA